MVIRLSKAAIELNVGTSTIVEFLHKKGFDLQNNPNSKVSEEMYELLKKEYKIDQTVKKASEDLSDRKRKDRTTFLDDEDIDNNNVEPINLVDKNFQTDTDKIDKQEDKSKKIIEEKIDKPEEKPDEKPVSTKAQETKEVEHIPTQIKEIEEIKVIGRIDLDSLNPQNQQKKKQKQKDFSDTKVVEKPQKDFSQNKQNNNQGKKEFSEQKKPFHKDKKEFTDKKQDVSKPKKDFNDVKQQPKKGKQEVLDNKQQSNKQKSGKKENETKFDQGTPQKEKTPFKDEKREKTHFKDEKRDKTHFKDEKRDKTHFKDDKRDKSTQHSDKKEINQFPKDKKEKTPFQHDKKEKAPFQHDKKEKAFVPKEKAPSTPEKPAQPNLQKEKKKTENFVPTKVQKLAGPTVIGKIALPGEPKIVEPQPPIEKKDKRKKKRKRIRKGNERVNIVAPAPTPPKVEPPIDPVEKENKEKKEFAKASDKLVNKFDPKKPAKLKKRPFRPEIKDEDVAKQIKDTLARLTSKGKSRTSQHKKDKRELLSQRQQEEIERKDQEKRTIRVTEFVTANELSNMINVPINKVIESFMSLGLFVSINQRLDAETIALVAEEFGYKVEFISISVAESIKEVADKPEDLIERPPIVTVMGHVDHGKTSLLDYIRKTSVISGEAGGITQHIGAYIVKLDTGRQITFLDTPGHQAFTAMRARGAQVTDIAIIVIAADDNIMPQTVEAINHAAAASVPIVFAINKIDKPNANPDKVKEELANMNYLVEDWQGKYQSQEISAKKGINVKELLEKVLLEADILELKANPNKLASGSVIESSLDKGRGYIATVLIQSGTLKIGDLILAGTNYGYVKAMFNERNQKVTTALPSEPVVVLGLNGAPQAGEKFNVMKSEKETKEIASKRLQLQREQGLRAQKHITLDEIGRRRAIGNFQELNLIVKGDVDGSVEALSDSLIKLSTEEIQVNVIHKAVGGISDSDIMLAAASNAIVIGFQVRPSLTARKIAEKEEIEIHLYSIIYDAIEEIKAAMEGMLSPEIKEQIHATVEILELFKITKVGTIAGCVVKEGKIKRTSKIRLIRDGIVVYTGELGSLKRFKDEAKEVTTGLECGLNIQNFNDMKVGDFIEAYDEIEVLRKL
ncbi:MAG: translation initiation factor IF-2 [Marinilabiliaceae bacterium]|nr:translation initiation factor IF-2 [Marinilabiliaceae bacterium]